MDEAKGDEVGRARDEGEDEGEDEKDEEDDSEGKGYTKRMNGDSNGGEAPELLFCVSGERKIPPCTMNATEDGTKDKQRQEVGKLMFELEKVV